MCLLYHKNTKKTSTIKNRIGKADNSGKAVPPALLVTLNKYFLHFLCNTTLEKLLAPVVHLTSRKGVNYWPVNTQQPDGREINGGMRSTWTGYPWQFQRGRKTL